MEEFRNGFHVHFIFSSVSYASASPARLASTTTPDASAVPR